MSTRKADIAELDQYYPPCGPCAFCGHRDKRHRLWDTIMAQYDNAGTSVEEIARWYDVEPEHVRAVLRIRPYRMTAVKG